jgi:hypothetical protein
MKKNLIYNKKMDAKLTIITGPKNCGKTLRANQFTLDCDIDKVVCVKQPEEYVSRVLDYWASIVKSNTRLVIIDDIDDEIFLYNMMLLYKHKKLAKMGISLVLVCEKNIKERKWVRNSVDHNIECYFIGISEII